MCRIPNAHGGLLADMNAFSSSTEFVYEERRHRVAQIMRTGVQVFPVCCSRAPLNVRSGERLSLDFDFARVAQLVEHPACNGEVGCSSQPASSSFCPCSSGLEEHRHAGP